MLILTEVNINEIYEDIILVNIAFYIPMGSFNNHMDMILHLFYPLPPSTWTFFTLYVDKYELILDPPPPSSCPRGY